MHNWNIFLIEVPSMLTSQLIETVKSPDKKPGSCSDTSSFFCIGVPLSNDQWNACIADTTRSVNASCSDVITVPLFFLAPPPRAIIPDAHPLSKFEN